MPGHLFKNGATAKGIYARFQFQNAANTRETTRLRRCSGFNTNPNQATPCLMNIEHFVFNHWQFLFPKYNFLIPLAQAFKRGDRISVALLHHPNPQPYEHTRKNDKEKTHLTITSKDASCENGRTKKTQNHQIYKRTSERSRSHWIAKISTSKLGGNTISP